ncbi:hypothetical protein R6Q59_005080 [Mikania micrantha]
MAGIALALDKLMELALIDPKKAKKCNLLRPFNRSDTQTAGGPNKSGLEASTLLKGRFPVPTGPLDANRDNWKDQSEKNAMSFPNPSSCLLGERKLRDPLFQPYSERTKITPRERFTYLRLKKRLGCSLH